MWWSTVPATEKWNELTVGFGPLAVTGNLEKK